MRYNCGQDRIRKEYKGEGHKTRIIKYLKTMAKKETEQINIREKIEDFLHSDSPQATAAKIILGILGLGVIVCTGAVVPGIIKVIESFRDMDSMDAGHVKNKKKKISKREIGIALSGLKRRKFIKIIKEKDGKARVKLTNKGRKRILEMSLELVKIKKPEKWDGKWRIVIFDIPVEKNLAREALRSKMKNLGFCQLQKSVWINPYECEDEILFIADAYGVEKYVEIITAENLLHEKEIRKAFNL